MLREGRTWVHWVLDAIAATVHNLPEGVAMRDSVAGVGIQGMNDFQRVGYGGPCPPKGPAHRYSFTLYALDTDLHLPPRKTKAELRKAMDGHILAQAELMGRCTRR
jgi:Raf kinase inhibitor-like YbhB/YbcL family protein